MTKHKEKEEDIIEQKDMKKEIEEELKDVESEESETPEVAEEVELTETEKLEKQVQENLDGWKRAQADFENYKKRQADSAKDLIRYASENVIMQIIPVLDNFQASTAHVPEDQKSNAWVTGIMYIQKQLEDVLKDQGVSEIDAKVGENFDPTLHEAIEDKECKSCKSKDYEFKNKIKQVVAKGYKIENKVIRPARVVVE
ncbi:MAG: nucleotide exchange factor GrpE [Parcubacteria group bacterium]|jgi:molecular chaperone GrpE